MKLLPLTSCLLSLFLSMTSPRAQAEPDPALHLYLLVGQSNMAGRGPLDEESRQSDPHVLMLTKALEWKPAADPLHFDKPAAAVGPGLAFGKIMAAAASPTVRIGLIPCAVGGSSIKAWVPGAEDKATRTHPYDDMLARALEAQKAGVLKGILWHQGESDRSSPEGYRQLLTELIARLRRDLKTDAPFVAGEIALLDPANARQTAAINAELHALETIAKNYACVSADALSHKGDKLHFDAASARLLGQRYAQKMLELQK